MELEIEPDPSEEERAAIEIALRRLTVRGFLPAAYTSAWRNAGLHEAVAADQAVARPRKSFGATLA